MIEYVKNNWQSLLYIQQQFLLLLQSKYFFPYFKVFIFDPMANTKKGTFKTKEKGQKDTIGINDIGIFEFILQGLPNPPDLLGMDED